MCKSYNLLEPVPCGKGRNIGHLVFTQCQRCKHMNRVPQIHQSQEIKEKTAKQYTEGHHVPMKEKITLNIVLKPFFKSLPEYSTMLLTSTAQQSKSTICVQTYVYRVLRLSVLPHALWGVACQASLSMGFSRKESWSGLPFHPPGYLPVPGIEPGFPTLQTDSLLPRPSGKPMYTSIPSFLDFLPIQITTEH